tara:strand:- start:922 stop:1410 length:489 start_codon:yes stop_codon:yes gene_type:complete
VKKIIIVMGVSGSGKSTLGSSISKALSIPFIEGDDYHTRANIKKMKNAIPLTDKDRESWLFSLSKELSNHKKNGAVLACSALKISYRKLLSNFLLKKSIIWVYLDCNLRELKNRLLNRNHFMPLSLLQSQLSTLEKPKDALYLKSSLSIKEMVGRVKNEINE